MTSDGSWLPASKTADHPYGRSAVSFTARRLRAARALQRRITGPVASLTLGERNDLLHCPNVTVHAARDVERQRVESVEAPYVGPPMTLEQQRVSAFVQQSRYEIGFGRDVPRSERREPACTRTNIVEIGQRPRLVAREIAGFRAEEDELLVADDR